MAPVREHGGPNLRTGKMLAIVEVVSALRTLVIVHEGQLADERVVEVTLAICSVGAYEYLALLRYEGSFVELFAHDQFHIILLEAKIILEHGIAEELPFVTRYVLL